MILASKFRALFIARKVFGFLIMFSFCFAFLFIVFDILNVIAFFISLFFAIIITLFRLKNTFKLIISETGITKISLLEERKRVINFSEIESFQLNRVDGITSDSGYISEGYYESVVLLKNNEKIIISPDCFENYKEIIKTLSKNYSLDCDNLQSKM